MPIVGWIWDNSEKLSQLATAAAAVFAFIAIIVAWSQIRKAQKSQQRSTAFQIYSDFLRYTLEHPEFITPALTEADVANCVWGGNEQKFSEYEVYVDLMIVVFEELMNVSDLEENLEDYMRTYLNDHRVYLQSTRFSGFENQLSPKFRSFLQKAYGRSDRNAVTSLPVAAE